MAKFTIEQVLGATKTKFTNQEGKTSLKISDRTIKESVEPLLPFAGEMEIDEFVTKVAFPMIDSTNRNYIKDTTDFVTSYKPTPPTPPTPPKDGFDMDAFFNRLAQSQQEAIVQATKPLQDELNAIRSEKMLATRHDSVINKVNELKLSKSWNVDFSNGIKIASLELGDKATAEEIFAKANEHFNATLSARGETYTPQPGDLGSSGSVDFSTTKAILQAEKERREKTN